MVERGQTSRSSFARKVSHGKGRVSLRGNNIRCRGGNRYRSPDLPGQTWKTVCRLAAVKLPKTPSRRKALRKLCQDFCDQRDGAMLPDKDIGESHLFMRLA